MCRLTVKTHLNASLVEKEDCISCYKSLFVCVHHKMFLIVQQKINENVVRNPPKVDQPISDFSRRFIMNLQRDKKREEISDRIGPQILYSRDHKGQYLPTLELSR